MKRLFSIFLISAFIIGCSASQPTKPDTASNNTEPSYACKTMRALGSEMFC